MYKLCGEVDKIMDFFSKDYNCGWVEKYLLSIAHDGQLPNTNTPLKYLMQYIYLIKYIADVENCPKVLVFPEGVDDAKNIAVDLVLDIGNSRTCGLLFESDGENSTYNFNSVQKLRLNDLSHPSLSYSDAFSMRLTFTEFNFGDIYVDGAHDQLFSWPSILRVGGEAERLLRQYDVNNHIIDEAANTLSSPKRYLWDKTKHNQSWEFVNLKGGFDFTLDGKSVHYPNITSHVTLDGRFTNDVLQGSKPEYSRGTLMVFVFIELLNQTLTQINSYDFRHYNENNAGRKRYLRNIVLTCPTAMSIKEQEALREHANTALKVLNNFNSLILKQLKDRSSMESVIDSNMDLSMFRIDSIEDNIGVASRNGDVLTGPLSKVKIIPNPDDIKIPFSERNDKKHWLYDEASTSQMLFIYGELAKKYTDNFEEFYELYGKKKADKNEYTLTVTSVDIGGGTTDVMICNYEYKGSDKNNEVTPDPIFWETYQLAGDDLLKEIVHMVIIYGLPIHTDDFSYDGGILRKYVHSCGIAEGDEKILGFFGSKYFGPMHNIQRKSSLIQVFLPIAYKFLDFLAGPSSENSISLYFDQIFKDKEPNRDIITYMNAWFNKDHTGIQFDLKKIIWTVDRDTINYFINVKFKELFKQISTISFAYKSDLILLSGRPTSLPEIRNIFINELPSTPDRVISMSNHKIGDWYPFSTVSGYLVDAKTTVSVGAMIYLLAGELGKLSGFSINTQKLRTKLHSTANYIGTFNIQNSKVNEIIISPNKNVNEFEIKSFPHILAAKQLKSENYVSRCLFRVEVDLDYIVNQLQRIHPTWDKLSLEAHANSIINSSFKVKILRDLDISHEALTIESVVDMNTMQPIDEKYLKLEVVSLKESEGYWLDTGQFIL